MICADWCVLTTWAHTWFAPIQDYEGKTTDDTIFLQQPCWSTTPPTISAAPAHWRDRKKQTEYHSAVHQNNIHYNFYRVTEDLNSACVWDINLLQANTHKRPKLDVHLSVCCIVAHVDGLHGLRREPEVNTALPTSRQCYRLTLQTWS